MRILCFLCFLCLVSLLWAALPASDNFTGTEGNAINGNWTLSPGVGAEPTYRSNTAGTDSVGNLRSSFWAADTWPNDQYSQATVVGSGGGASVIWAVQVRTITSGGSRQFYAGGREANSFNGNIRIWKFVSGTGPTSICQGGNVFGLNDVIKLTATGTSLEVFENGVSRCGPTTDSAIASGSAGIGLMHPTTANASMLDDWSGDQIGGAADEPPLRRVVILGWLRTLVSHPGMENRPIGGGAKVRSWLRALWPGLIPTAEAQSTFTRLYVVPVRSFTTSEGSEARVANYDDLLCAIGCATMDFGYEPVMLVAGEMDATRDAAVTANADVLALPLNLDQNLSAAAVSATQARLEALNIPAGWVSTSLTYRQVLRPVAAMFQFAQRYHGLTGARLFPSEVTLDTAFGSLPSTVQQNLVRAAESLGYDTSALTASTTLRQALKAMSDQWGARPIRLNGVEL